MNFKKLGLTLLTATTLFAQTASFSVFAQEDNEPVKIGANMETSGYSASYGQAMLDAIELAAEEVNADGGLLGGRQVEVVHYDNKSDKTETASVATRLVEEGVAALIGPGATDLVLAQNPVAQQSEVSAVIPAATADDLTLDADGNVMEWVFRLAFSYTYQANAAARFATDELGAQKAVVLVDQSNDYSVGQAEPFKAEWEALGNEVVLEESYTGGDTDFSAVLTTLLATDFDVIYLPAFYTEGGLITKQAREMGITQPILSGHGFASDAYVELAGAENATDVYYTSNFYTGTEEPAGKEFVEAYEAKYGKKPDTFGALGYDGAKLLFQAIEDAGSTDPAAVRDAIENMESFTGGVTGEFYIDEDHNAVKPAPMLHLVNGEVINIYEVDGTSNE